jgi:diadenosine tetraphosphate (Ap4A) HIT family hydrolase
MTCPLCERLAGPDAMLIATLAESAVLLGDNQGCRGWCVLVLRRHVEHLDELDEARQARVFAEVARVARAIRAEFPASGAGGGPPRINYECLGNQVAHVHWHVIPRHADDPDPRSAVWGRAAADLRGDMSGADRQALATRLRARLGGRPIGG